jgi:TolA-binding protein
MQSSVLPIVTYFQGGETNYRRAAGFYQKVVDNNYPNQDYALYQLSLIYSLQGKTNKQIQVADRLLASYPESPFADDVLYAKGSTLIDVKEFLDAKSAFDQLIIKYPNSEFNASALYKLGVISYDNDQRLEALEYFKKVVAINIQTEEAKSSLSFIRRIYVEDGDPDGFMAYASTLQGYNFSDMAADSLLYEAAIQSFEKEEYAQAASNFTKYLDRFPKGLNSMAAHLNRGICYYNEKQYSPALNDFAYVSDANNPPAPPAKAEQANLLAGKISYHITQNYVEAQKYFTRLEQFASNADNRFEALLFGMRSAHFAKDMVGAQQLAEKFLQEANATAQNKAEAYFYIAKGNLASKNYAQARQKFDQSIKLVGDDIRASEARYQIAKIWYIERNLEKAQEIAFQNNKELGQHLDWLARNFILIADIYAEQENLDAAKGTLESLLANYKGDPAIVQEAKDKLEKVKQAISSNSRLKRNDDNGELEMLDD